MGIIQVMEERGNSVSYEVGVLSSLTLEQIFGELFYGRGLRENDTINLIVGHEPYVFLLQMIKNKRMVNRLKRRYA